MRSRLLILLALPLYWSISALSLAEVPAPIIAQTRPPPAGGARFTGRVELVSGPTLLLTLRTGQSLMVDWSEALKNNTAAIANAGTFVMVEGALSSARILKATVVLRAKSSKSNWLPDIY